MAGEDGSAAQTVAGEVLLDMTALRFRQHGCEETLANGKFLVPRDHLLSEDRGRWYMLKMLQNISPLFAMLRHGDADLILKNARRVSVSERLAVLYVYVIDDGNPNGRRSFLFFFGESTEARGSSKHSGVIRGSLTKLRRLRKVRAGDCSEQSSCVICLGEFSADDDVGALPCSHVYHRCCVVRWLVKRDSCPLCRSPTTLDSNK